MSTIPEIYVDWNDNYGPNLIELDCAGSQRDIEKQGITLTEGLKVKIYGDELEAEAIIRHFPNERTWVAEVLEGTLKTVR